MKHVWTYVLVTVLGLLLPATAGALDKAELIDAIASGAKLTKADAGRVLEAVTDGTAKALKKGDRLSLVGFGSFSVSKRTTSPNGCASEIEVDFAPASTFNAKKEEGGRHTPFHNKFARIVPQSDGSILVFGPNNGAAVAKGLDVYVQKRPGRNSSASLGVILGVIVQKKGGENSYEILENGAGKSVQGVVVGGVERSAFEVGGSLETLPPVIEDDPIGACPEDGFQGYIVSDDELLKEIQAATRLPQDALYAAYNVLLDTIIAAVNDGELVDLGGFGLFVEESTISATVADDPCAGLPENCPPDTASATVYPYIHVDVSIQTGALSEAELKRLETVVGVLAREARPGRNPQTGKEIKIAAKKVVKFKAGAELSDKVN